MALGDFRFSLSTAAYQQFERTSSYSWTASARIGVEAAVQFVGIGQEEITLTGTIYPHFRGGYGQIEKMRTIAAKGEPLFLVSGFENEGRVWGDYSITRVIEKQQHIGADGKPLRMDFTLHLIKYGDDNG
ncbi:MAG: phage tail protein [Pseudomonadota bacterium]